MNGSPTSLQAFIALYDAGVPRAEIRRRLGLSSGQYDSRVQRAKRAKQRAQK